MIELNKVLLVGRLTRDPETRYTQQGTAIASFSIAVNRRRGRDKEDEVSFIDCEAWDKQAEFLQQWFKKGSAVFLDGRLKMDRWQDKTTGQNRSKLVVVAEAVRFAESKASEEGRGQGGGGSYGSQDDGGGGDGPSYHADPPVQQQRPAPRPSARPQQAPPPQHDGGGSDATDDDLPF